MHVVFVILHRIIYGVQCLIQDHKYFIDFIKHLRVKRQINASAVIQNELVWNAGRMLIQDLTVLSSYKHSHT